MRAVTATATAGEKIFYERSRIEKPVMVSEVAPLHVKAPISCKAPLHVKAPLPVNSQLPVNLPLNVNAPLPVRSQTKT